MTSSAPSPTLSTSSSPLLNACILDGEGGGQHIDSESVTRWTEDQGVLWLHVDFQHPGAATLLSQQAGLPKLVVEALQLNDTRPRGDSIGDGLLVVLRGVNHNPGADPDDMVAVRVWIDPNRIITSRRRRLMSVMLIQGQLDQGRGPRSPGGFLLTLVERLGNGIAEVVDALEDSVDALEEEITGESASLHDIRLGLSGVRRQCARLRRHIAPQRDALERLYREVHPLINNAIRLELREEADRLRRYVEDIDLVRERAMVAQEQIQAQLAEQQNQRMYVLSIVAAIFLPLGFVTGLLGMNVGGIPGEGVPLAFSILIGLMLALTVGLVALFRWRKWL